MGSNEPLLEPLKGYNSTYKEAFKENATKYFDDLVKKSNLNIEENKATVKAYKEKLAKIEELKKVINGKKALRAFLIILMIILGIVGIAFMYNNPTYYVNILILVGCIALIVLFIILIVKKINPIIKSSNDLKAKLEKEAKELLQAAYRQMASLNALYDWGIPGELITKTIPLIEWDKYFDVQKYQYLHDKFGLVHNDDNNVSTYYCMSGSILGNPFLICKDYKQRWIQKTYTGSLTIHWVEQVRTDKGYKTVTRTQVLTASIQRPAPSYNYETYLIYGNDAAPDLKFYRNPSEASGKTEKQIDKMVDKGTKKLNKKAEKAVMNNSSYTRLGNDEFEVLFGGSNRNNEVQYRLLFTPLAQKNLLQIIKNPKPYGDDFYFEKDLKLNYIQSKHSQYFDYYASPSRFVHYDYEYAKNNFVSYMCEFFEAFYFDMAPLMSIPLYQQTKTHEYIYNEGFDTNVSPFEHESIANSFNTNYLKPDNADTPSILKTRFMGKAGKGDNVNIDAYAFEAERRLTYVSRLGGDGHYHNVPVYWFEYMPIEKTTPMVVEEKKSSRFEFNCYINNKDFASTISKYAKDNQCLYERGLFAILLNKLVNDNDMNAINNIYQENSYTSNSISSEEIVKDIENEVNTIKNINGSNIEDVEKLVNKLNDDSIVAKEMEATDDDNKSEE